tara:strand:- start:148664 stop:149689 length:1026 start_codon:yes stop_codon:yes gene_type:complete
MCEKHTTGVGPYATQMGFDQSAIDALKKPFFNTAGACAYFDLGTIPKDIARWVIQIEVSKFACYVQNAQGEKSPIQIEENGTSKTIQLAMPENGVDAWIHDTLRDYLHLQYAPLGVIAPYFNFGFRLFNEDDKRHGSVQVFAFAHAELVTQYGTNSQGYPNVPWTEKGGCCVNKGVEKLMPFMQSLSADKLRQLPQKLSGSILYRFMPMDESIVNISASAKAENCITHLIKDDGSKVEITMKNDDDKDISISLMHPMSCYVHPHIRQMLQVSDKPSSALFRETYVWGFVNHDTLKGMVFMCLAPERNIQPAAGDMEEYIPEPLLIATNGQLAKKRCPACKS